MCLLKNVINLRKLFSKCAHLPSNFHKKNPKPPVSGCRKERDSISGYKYF